MSTNFHWLLFLAAHFHQLLFIAAHFHWLLFLDAHFWWFATFVEVLMKNDDVSEISEWFETSFREKTTKKTRFSFWKNLKFSQNKKKKQEKSIKKNNLNNCRIKIKWIEIIVAMKGECRGKYKVCFLLFFFL